MRFTLIAFAALAVALTSAAASGNNDSTGDNALEEAIEFISSGGDPMGDDDFASPTRRSSKHHHKAGRKSATYVSSKPANGAKMMTKNAKVTWYASQDLKNPQCGDGSWSPNNNCHIGAVMAGWDNGPQCGEFVQLCNEKMSPHKCVKVRIVDKCAGCKADHVDLTKSAFKQLAPSHSLDEGVVNDLVLYKNGKPSPWDLDLFGPLNLKG